MSEATALLPMVTRRGFLAMSALIPVPISWARASSCRYSIGEFDIDSTREWVIIRKSGTVLWQTRTSWFEGAPELSVRKASSDLHIKLTNALYPGTLLPADFSLTIARHESIPFCQLRLSLGDSLLEGRLDEWLNDNKALTGESNPLLHFDCGSRDLRCRVQNASSAGMYANWTLELVGETSCQIDFLDSSISAGSLTLRLGAPPAWCSGDVNTEVLGTIANLRRRDKQWQIRPQFQKNSLAPPPSAFDDAEVFFSPPRGDNRTAEILVGPTSTASEIPYVLHEFDTTERGAPAALPLSKILYAAAFDSKGFEAALLGDIAEAPSWISLNGCGVLLARRDGQPQFEAVWQDGRIVQALCMPTIHGMHIPSPSGNTGTITAMAGRMLSFEQLEGLKFTPGPGEEKVIAVTAGIDPASRMKAEINNPSVTVQRREDFMNLQFDFVNLTLVVPAAGTGKDWYLKRTITGKPAFMTVRFPPQSIGERAFRKVTDPDQPPYTVIDPPVQSHASGESRLVFQIRPDLNKLPYDLKTLMEWDSVDLLPQLIPERRKADEIKAPSELETAIWAPYRLVLSPPYVPDEAIDYQWVHSIAARGSATGEDREAYELWVTQLRSISYVEVCAESSLTEMSFNEQIQVPVVWTPDWDGSAPEDNPVKETSLSADDRRNLVVQSHLEGAALRLVSADWLKLSAFGAWLQLEGYWPKNENGPGSTTLEKWQHILTMGRDEHVVVAYRGFMFPLGHRAVLIQETKRTVEAWPTHDDRPSIDAAYLRKTTYIVVRQPVRENSDPLLPFTSVQFKTLKTPPLIPVDENGGIPRSSGGTWGPTAFWPQILQDGQAIDFEFEILGIDWQGVRQTFSAALIFVADDASPDDPVLWDDCQDSELFKDAKTEYAADAARQDRPMDGQHISVAPSYSEGDTKLQMFTLALTAACGPATSTEDSDTDAKFHPIAERYEASIPVLKQFLESPGDGRGWFAPVRVDGSLEETYAETTENVAEKRIRAPFGTMSDRSGAVAAPDLRIGALSRRFGPIGAVRAAEKKAGVALDTPPAFAIEDFFTTDATILGSIRLSQVISLLPINEDGSVPTIITSETDIPDGPNYLEHRIGWKTVNMRSYSVFRAQQDSKEDVPDSQIPTSLAIDGKFTARLFSDKPPTFYMLGDLRNFGLKIEFFGIGVLVKFNKMTFSSSNEQRTKVDVDIRDAKFLGALAFLNDLKKYLAFGNEDESGKRPILQLDPTGVTIRLPPLTLPRIAIGAFSMENLVLRNECRVSFDGKPVEYWFLFSSHENPFLVTVAMYGGGGHCAIDVVSNKVQRLSAAIEFGAQAALNIGPANGRVYVFGGIYYEVSQDSGVASFIAYVRAGGAVEIFSIITISLEIYLALGYDSGANPSRLYGRAEITGRIKVGFFSKSYSFSYEKEFIGSSSANLALGAPAGGKTGDFDFEDGITLAAWREYVAAFAN